MSELFLMAQWDEVYAFLAAGNPPLAIQLLIVNTIFLIILVIRRMRGASALRSDTYLLVQALLIVANAAIVFQGQIAAYL